MKILLPFLSVAFLAACNSTPKESATTAVAQEVQSRALDTTGYAKYQDWKAQNELSEIESYNAPQQQTATAAPVKKAYKAPVKKAAPVAAAPRRRVATKSSAPSNSGSQSTASNGSGTMNNEGSNGAKAPQAEEKKGWGTTAKSTVIGAAGGAVIGAVINKKNRAAGAVIGGVLGGGAGYGLGKILEKKEAQKKAETNEIK